MHDHTRPFLKQGWASANPRAGSKSLHCDIIWCYPDLKLLNGFITHMWISLWYRQYRLISRKTINIPHTNPCELNTFWMSKLCTFEVRKTKNQTCLDAQVHICTLTPGHGFIPGASRSQPWLSITTCAGTAECEYRYGAWTPADTMWIRWVRSMVTQVDRLWLDEKEPHFFGLLAGGNALAAATQQS